MNFKNISMYLASIIVVSFLIDGIILFSTGGLSCFYWIFNEVI